MVVHEFTRLLEGPDGTLYVVRVHGAPLDQLWEGWLTFADGDRLLQTGRETTQPNLQALEYWASGLEPIYLQGALERAHEQPVRKRVA